MERAIEKAELRELTDLEIENVSGAHMGTIVTCVTAIYMVGFAVGLLVGRAENAQ